jgi:hypothetical protein
VVALALELGQELMQELVVAEVEVDGELMED